MQARLAILVGLLALCACGRTDDGRSDEAAGPAQTGDQPTTDETFAVVPVSGFALSDDGLVMLPAAGESAKTVAFGTPRAEVEEAVALYLDDEPQRYSNAECGAGPIDFTEYGALTLTFQNDRFTGWFAGEGTGVATIDGIRPGVTREVLESERSVVPVPDTTLDGEFEYTMPNGSVIAGFFEGSGPKSEVVALYAGVNCFFR